jgi:hypothetical protein
VDDAEDTDDEDHGQAVSDGKAKKLKNLHSGNALESTAKA